MSGLGRVLITGGGGAIGSNMTDELVHRRAPSEVVVLDNFVRGRRENLAWATANGNVDARRGRHPRRGARARADATASTSSSTRPPSASRSAPRSRGWRSRSSSTAPTTSFEAAAQAGVRKRRRRVVGLGLRAGRGVPHRARTTTRTPTTRSTARPRSSTRGCCAASTRCTGLDYVALRYFNVYGPRMDVHGLYTEVLVRWMERIAAGEPPLIFGDGLQTMDFIYVGDIARANVLAADSDVTDAGLQRRQRRRRRACSSSPRCCCRSWTPTSRSSTGPRAPSTASPRRLADTNAARERLGFEAEVGPRGGLTRLVDLVARRARARPSLRRWRGPS